MAAGSWPAFSSLSLTNEETKIRSGQLMIAADDLLEPFTAVHDFEDQSTRLRMPFRSSMIPFFDGQQEEVDADG